jgi:peptidoglycan/xylan/chitin deacetylase (PgdA/CDA1 family)
VATQSEAPRIAFTFDDFNVFDVPALSGASRNNAILEALRANGLKAAVFVIGRYVEDSGKMGLLQLWNDAGHIVGNHTYSHRRYSRADFSEFTKDILANEAKLNSLSRFRKWLRFPFLDEGVTADQRDRMRGFLADAGYRNAHVTIDASDWYVDGRLRARLEKDREADVAPYRRFYLDHIWERALYYETLSRQVVGRRIHQDLTRNHAARSIVHDRRLSEATRQMRADQTRGEISGAANARGEQPQRSLRKIRSARNGRERHACGEKSERNEARIAHRVRTFHRGWLPAAESSDSTESFLNA